MWKHFFLSLLLLAPIFSWSSSSADPRAARGAALIKACAACHGPEGHSHGAIPSIDTMTQESLTTALRAFRADERQGTVMSRVAKGLDDDDIAALAAYVEAKQKH